MVKMIYLVMNSWFLERQIKFFKAKELFGRLQVGVTNNDTQFEKKCIYTRWKIFFLNKN